jgi:hypothetical protein
VVDVKEDAAGRPLAVLTPFKQMVAGIDDCWRIDDEWWRDKPVSRLYYAVLFKSGQSMVIYKDLVKNEWYRQVY